MRTKPNAQGRTLFLLPFFLFHFLIIGTAPCQPAVQWDKTYGSSGNDQFVKLLPLPDGSYIIGATINDILDGDITDNPEGLKDYWIAKCNPQGDILWDQAIGGSADDILADLVLTNDGGFLLGGYSNSGASGDKTQPNRNLLNGQPSRDYWIVRLDGQGNKIWDRTYGSGGLDEVKSVAALPDGGFIIAGESRYSNGAYDRSEQNRGQNEDLWIIKLDNQGNLIWEKTFGGRELETGARLTVLGDGSTLVTSSTFSRNDGYMPAGNGSMEVWLIKLASDGQVVWQKLLGGPGADFGIKTIETSDGGLLVGGYSYSNTGGDKQSGYNGNKDAWLIKTDNNGNRIWDMTYGGSQEETIVDLAELQGGGYAVLTLSNAGIGGDKSEPLRLDESSPNYSSDFWMFQTDQTGNLLWEKTFGGPGNEIPKTLWVQSDHEIILAGGSSSKAGYEKTTPNLGFEDIWLLKVDLDEKACGYPLPPAKVCDKDRIVCQLDGYCSTTSPPIETACPVAFCNGWILAENPDYIAFIAGTANLILEVTVSNCSNVPNAGIGLEAAIFSGCDLSSTASNCWSTVGETTFQLVADNLIVDSTYILFVDGVDGSFCDYSIKILDGRTGPSFPEVAVDPLVMGCFVDKLVLSNNQLIAGGNVSYQWSSTTGQIVSGDKTLYPTIRASGQYFLKATNEIGYCQSSVTKEVVVQGPALSANFKVSGCSGNVMLDAGTALIEPGVNYEWAAMNGGAIVSGGNSLTPTVQNNGELALILSYGVCSDTFSTSLPAGTGQPFASITVDYDTDACDFTTRQDLDGSASTQSDDLDYYWHAENRFVWTTGNDDDWFAQATGPGVYYLTIVDPVTGCMDSTSLFVDWDDSTGFYAAIPYIEHFGCNRDTTQLTVVTPYDSPHLNFIWESFNGNFITATDIRSPLIDQPGNYSVFVYDDSTGCGGGQGIWIFEYDPPVNLVITASDTLDCIKDQIRLTASATSNYDRLEYEWSTADGFIIEGGNTDSPLIGSAGTYAVTVTGRNGGCTEEGTFVVGEEILPPIISPPSNTMLTCQTPTLQLDLSGSSSGPGYCYWWETADGHLAGPPNVLNPTVDQPGTYTLTIGNLQTGCTAQQDITVSGSNEQPVAQAIPTATIECGQISVQLNGSGSSTGSGFSYQWATPDGEIISGDNGLAPEVTAAGQYVLTVTALNGGCTQTATVQVDDNRFVLEESLPVSICEGEVYQLGGQVFDQAGEYDVPFLNIDGCDSIVHLSLMVLTLPEASIEVSICDGESYEFGGQDINAGGAYTHTSVAANGCDSTTFLQLTVLDAPQTGLEVSVCPGEGYTVGTNTYNQSGNYVEVLQSINGCDSTVTLELDVMEVFETEMAAAICLGDTYQFGSQNIGAAGVYYDTLSSVAGCDSVLILNLGVLEKTVSNITASICEGESYQIGSSVYSQNGSFVDTLMNVNGCDSIVELDLTVFTASATLIEEVICEGESIVIGNMAYGVAGTYLDTLENANGCDSTVTLELAVVPTIFVADTLVQPDNGSGNGAIGVVLGGGEPPFAYSWSNGGTGDSITGLVAGSYSVTVEDASGCLAEFTFEVLLQTGATEALMAGFNTKLYPNPAITNSTITLKVDTPGRVELEITVLDILGREFSLHAVKSLAGENTFDVPCPTFPGIYFVVIRYSGQVLAMDKMVVAGE